MITGESSAKVIKKNYHSPTEVEVSVFHLQNIRLAAA